MAGILDSIRNRGRGFPHTSDATEKTFPPLGLMTKAKLVALRARFTDKFGRDHELVWATVQNISTGQEHQALFNLKFWPDPHYLELAVDCHVAVEPDSNFLRGSGWDRQPEELKKLVYDRLENPELRPNVSTPLVLEDERTDPKPVVSNQSKQVVDQVEIDNSPMHPCLPAMTQIIAAVSRQAKQDGLVACGYVLADPSIFVDYHDHHGQNS